MFYYQIRYICYNLAMKEVSHKDIATYVNKSINTINGWTNKFPELLELVKIGAFCKKNDLDITSIKKLAELKKMFKD